MEMQRSAVVPLIHIYMYAMFGVLRVTGSETVVPTTKISSLQPSSFVQFGTSSVLHTAANTIESSVTTHQPHDNSTVIPLSTSENSVLVPTSKSQTIIQITSSHHWSLSDKILQPSKLVNHSLVSLTARPSTVLTEETSAFIQQSLSLYTSLPKITGAESLYSIMSTNHQPHEGTMSFLLTSDGKDWSASVGNYYTLTESYSAILSSISSVLEMQSAESKSAAESSSYEPVLPSVSNIVSTIVTQSQSMVTWATTSTMPATEYVSTSTSTSISSTPSSTAGVVKSSWSGDDYTGRKIAIGIVVSMCILGLVAVAFFVYKKYNFTHRSLKSFLTSGVRYKTYNNATYKDDEVVGDVGLVNELT